MGLSLLDCEFHEGGIDISPSGSLVSAFLRRFADWPCFQGLPIVRLLRTLKGTGKAVWRMGMSYPGQPRGGDGERWPGASTPRPGVPFRIHHGPVCVISEERTHVLSPSIGAIC